MKLYPQQIFKEYRDGIDFKSGIGNRGMYEQNLINERFFIGDQWHGAKCGNERPLVRHNIIKRIGDYKMSHVLSNSLSVSFSADGIPNTVGLSKTSHLKKNEIANNESFKFEGNADTEEINLVMSALSSYRDVTAERIGFSSLSERALRNAYITGSSIIYTYWDSNIITGLYADNRKNVTINGDINCEVLDIENVYFGDPYIEDVQSQPYIIISSCRSAESVKREAALYGATKEKLDLIGDGDENGKIIVLTRLYKEYKNNGAYTIKCVKATEKTFIRREFDTGLHLYPLALFNWEYKNNMIYGESEITYLIPNQIAINRMLTANVWSAMTMGMPIMVVNGDTVTGNITNDPGQIIKIFGSNEDVAGAVKYVTPPGLSGFDENINNLINNTLTQSGANEVALGDSKADNATALATMRDAANMPLQLIKERFNTFVEELSRIWADFWVTQYGDRRIKIQDENGVWYMPFNSERYGNLFITAKVNVGNKAIYSDNESINSLLNLYDKGIISKKQLLERIPSEMIPDISGILIEIQNTEDDDERI